MASDSQRNFRLAFGLALAAFAGLFSLGLFLRATRPADPAQVTERFLAHLADGSGREAFTDAAAALRRARTAEMLRLELRRLGLVSYARSSWPDVTIDDHEATVEGSVTTREGAVVALLVTLVREEDQWRVASVTAAPAGD
jgi:hypothetical protein